MDPSPAPAASAPGAVIVTGMHRSGTSLLASFLGAAGVSLGENLLPPAAPNPRGYFEDVEFLQLQQEILHASTPQESGWRDWGWTESQRLDFTGLPAFRARAEALVRQRQAAGRPWGWKDPRTTILLDFWHGLVPEARFIFIYRTPWEVAASIAALHESPFQEHPDFAPRIWMFYNQQISQFFRRHRDRCLLLEAGALLARPDEVLALARTKLGLEVAAAGGGAALLRQVRGEGKLGATAASDSLWRVAARAYRREAQTWEELEQLADLPAGRRLPQDDALDAAAPRLKAALDAAAPRSTTALDAAAPRSTAALDAAAPRSTAGLDAAAPRSTAGLDAAAPGPVAAPVAAAPGPVPPPAGPAASAPGMAAGATGPDFTVVIPCFNQGEFLLAAVASVEAVTDVAHELVIVNDGSTEPFTLEILGRLRSAGQRVLDRPNGGVGAARNTGIAASRGRYVLPLDADNRILPAYLCRAATIFAADPTAGVVYGDATLAGQRNGLWRMPEFDIEQMATGNRVDACGAFRRQVWEECGGYDESIDLGWEDWDFWLTVAERGWRFVHVPELLFEYRVQSDSIAAVGARQESRRRMLERITAKHAPTFAPRLPRMFAEKDAHWLAAEARAAALGSALDRERSASDSLHGDLDSHLAELEAARRELDAARVELAAVHAGHAAACEEIGRWRERVDFMSATRAWRWRAVLVHLRTALSRRRHGA